MPYFTPLEIQFSGGFITKLGSFIALANNVERLEVLVSAKARVGLVLEKVYPAPVRAEINDGDMMSEVMFRIEPVHIV